MTIFIPCPPKTYDGRTNNGKSKLSANLEASSALSAIPNFGNGMFNLVNKSEKRPLSSAKSKASNDVPKILIPYFANFSANFSVKFFVLANIINEDS
jgi:hypothetical protein